MKFSVQVKTRSKKEGVERTSEGTLIVRVHLPPAEGRANVRVCELLSEYFDKPKSCIHIVSGHSSKNKIIEIE